MSNGQRLDAIMARKYTDRDGNEKSAFTRLGTAFPNKNGDGYSIVLDAMPVPEASRDGGLQYRILLMTPKPRDGEAPRDQGSYADKRPAASGGGRPGGYGDDGDEIPFLCEWR